MSHILLLTAYIFLKTFSTILHDSISEKNIKEAIFKSVRFLDEKISVNGGYVWYYKKDLSRRWGELEAYPTMIWVQGFGTVAMGNLFLDIYEVTSDEYYYKLARKSALALIKGQLKCGGWNYFIDFAGKKSTKKWYSTIGANAWRMEEFQHYYGNATFDDEVTAGAAKFLLRIYLLKKDKEIKKSLDQAINFILKSQYPNGAWPQRYPFVINKNDYTRYYTFNDNVIWNNIKFLILCYAILNDKKLIEPIKKGMNFYILSQYKKPQAGWAQQYNLKMEPAQARTYEPAALDPQYTARHIEMLIKFYEMTGDKKFLKIIPDAIDWIKSVSLEKKDSILIVPKFVELKTNKPLYIHRKGSNKFYGNYYVDYDSNYTVPHYPCTRVINLKLLTKLYEHALQNKLKSKNTFKLPLSTNKTETFKLVENYLLLPSEKVYLKRINRIDEAFVKELLLKEEESLCFSKDVYISNPFIGYPEKANKNSFEYCCSFVGDKYDTSTYPNNTEEEFISIRQFIINIKLLLNQLENLSDRKKE